MSTFEAVEYIATSDSQGASLDPSCNYIIQGSMAPARGGGSRPGKMIPPKSAPVWEIGTVAERAHRTEQPGAGDRLARSQPGNWLKLPRKSYLEFTLTLFSPASSVKSGNAAVPLPEDREGSMFMRRRLFWLAAVILLAVSVHLSYVLFVPNLEMSRIMSAAGSSHGENRFTVLSEKEATSILGQQSLAFVQGICVSTSNRGRCW